MEATIDRNIIEIELLSEAIKLYSLQSEVLTESADIQVLNESVSETIKKMIEKLKELIRKIISSIKSKLSNNEDIEAKYKATKFNIQTLTKNEVETIKNEFRKNYKIILPKARYSEFDDDDVSPVGWDIHYESAQWSYNELTAEITDVKKILEDYDDLMEMLDNHIDTNDEDRLRTRSCMMFISSEIDTINTLKSKLFNAYDELIEIMNQKINDSVK